MSQTLEQLIKLQEIDQRLLEIKELMGDLPVKVEIQEKEIKALEEENLNKHKRLDEIEKNIRHHVAEIDNFSSKLKKHKDQLFLVKSNKEYDAISLEIDHMKTTISESENVQFNFEQEKVELEENVKLNTDKISNINESLTKNKSDLDLAMADTISEQNELETNRNVLFGNIKSSYLDAYEKLRIARNGIGMASIIGRACGGCYSELPPQTIIEIKENNKIITCPNCSLLQFWDGVDEF